MNSTKKLIQSKTFWVSVATVCTGIGAYVSGEQMLQELIIIIVGSVFGVLRLFTDKGIK